MAKHNLFLGTASGSVGDVTFYRANGQQIARARNRKPRNPNTPPQLFTRAILATVAQAYRVGSVIFDHAFEGKSVGAESQRVFMKRNLDLLRNLVSREFNEGTPAAAGTAVVVSRGATAPVPFIYRVSEGTLYQSLFSVAVDPDDANKLLASLPAAGAATTLGEWAQANGLVADDIYTIVGYGFRNTSGWSATAAERFSTQYDAGFGFIRLRVRAEALASTTALNAATYNDLFEMNFANATPLPESTLLMGTGINIDQVVSSALTGTMGVIRSREDSGLRSTTDLVAPDFINWGIKTENLLAAWTPGSESAGNSDLVLEGGGF